jgi:CubicO group peptidase (beta-lactamase class C family)
MIRSVVALCALATLAWAPPVFGAASQPVSLRKVTVIRGLVEKALTDLHAPGATVAIGLGGQVAWTEGFGFSDVENHVRATAATAYRTASIGKSMTATAAMKLAETGKLDLDAPIQTYCPQFPIKPWRITARDLISHTSGIRHYGGPNEQNELYNTRRYERLSDAINLFKDDPLKQQPGDDFLYSTWGYVTLGCVLEGASGQEYRALMRRLIFDPAGLASTREDDPRAIIPNRARGYALENGQLVNSRWVDMSSKMAAGGWITTAADLVRFENAWMAGRLVSPKAMAAMMTPYRLPRGKGTVDNFGLGWFLDSYHGLPMALYGGGTPQVSGFIFFVPQKKISVAILFNLEDVPAATRADLAEAIADVVLGESAPNHGFYNSKPSKQPR